MKRPIKRSFGILDGMLIVVGAAIAIALMRLYYVNNYKEFASRLQGSPNNSIYVSWIMGEAANTSCLWLTPLTLTVFFIRLRNPRPTISRLMLQPGATACFSVAALVALGSILIGIVVAMEGSGPWTYYYDLYGRLFPYAGVSVVGVWAVQGLGRRWRPEAGGIDRLGRLLGICWIATFLILTLTWLQQGASIFQDMQEWKAQRQGSAQDVEQEVMKSMDDEIKNVQADTKKMMLEHLEHAKAERVRLKQLLDDGDADQMKAEIRRREESYAQEERDIVEWQAQHERDRKRIEGTGQGRGEALDGSGASPDPKGPLPIPPPPD
jgi:hypothetical protein